MGECPDPENCPSCRAARDAYVAQRERIATTSREQRAIERSTRRADARDQRKQARRALRRGAASGPGPGEARAEAAAGPLEGRQGMHVGVNPGGVWVLPVTPRLRVTPTAEKLQSDPLRAGLPPWKGSRP
jgi:hypothetical protein